MTATLQRGSGRWTQELWSGGYRLIIRLWSSCILMTFKNNFQLMRVRNLFNVCSPWLLLNILYNKTSNQILHFQRRLRAASSQLCFGVTEPASTSSTHVQSWLEVLSSCLSYATVQVHWRRRGTDLGRQKVGKKRPGSESGDLFREQAVRWVESVDVWNMPQDRARRKPESFPACTTAWRALGVTVVQKFFRHSFAWKKLIDSSVWRVINFE